MIRYFLFVILLIINIHNIHSLPKTYPVSDEAAILTSDEFEIGALCGFYSKMFVSEYNFKNSNYFFQFPVRFIGMAEYYNYEKDEADYEFRNEMSSQYLFLIIPCLNLSFNYSTGLGDNVEIGYSMFISTPDTYQGECYSIMFGPHYKFLFFIKKNIFSRNTAVSYRFALELDYNSGPGFDIGIKNSFIFGKNDKTKSNNFIFSLYNYFGYSYITFNAVHEAFYTGIITQLEYTKSICSISGFNFVFSFYCNINYRFIFSNEEYIDYIYMYEQNFTRISQMDFSFGIQLSFQKRVNKNN